MGKFCDNAGRALPPGQVEVIERTALSLDALPDVSASMILCGA